MARVRLPTIFTMSANGSQLQTAIHLLLRIRQSLQAAGPFPSKVWRYGSTVTTTTKSLLHPRAYSPRPDEKIIDDPRKERCQRIRLSMTRKPLNGLFRRAVQCRDQSVVKPPSGAQPPKQGKYEEKKRRKKAKGAPGEKGLYRGWWRH